MLKRRGIIVPSLVMLLLALAMPATGLANDKVEPGTAVKVANQLLETFVIPKLYPQWSGASAHEPVLMLTSEGTPAAYGLRVVVGPQVVGYILVGATSEMSPFISAGTATTLFDGEQSLANKAKANLRTGQSLGHKELLYGGPMNLAVRFYVLEKGQKVGEVMYDLLWGDRVDKISAPVSSPEYRALSRSRWQKELSGSSGISPMMILRSKDLQVPSYNQYSISDAHKNSGCGPTAGAEIFRYWDGRGYSGVGMTSLSVVDFIEHMYFDMSATAGGTEPLLWADGMENHGVAYGHPFQSDVLYWSNTTRSGMWSSLTSELMSDRPVGMFFPLWASPYSWHYVAGRGFYEDTSGYDSYHVNVGNGSDAWHDYASTSDFHLLTAIPQ